MTKPLIILDRDGVINEDSPDYIKSPDEWHAIPGSLEAIAALHKAGITVHVATNQSGIKRGFYSLKTLSAIHQKMIMQLENLGGHITHIAYCPHGPDDNCHCRKPKPGLLEDCCRTADVSPKQAYFIGDSLRDLQAAQAIGAKPILVRCGNGEKTLKNNPNLPKEGIAVYDNLAAFVQEFLSVDMIQLQYP